MFWRATLAIAALYYVTVPAEDRRQAESELRAAAGQVPARTLSLCQEKPQLCAEALRQAGTALAPAAPAGPEPQAKTEPPSRAEPGRQVVEGVPLPPRRPAMPPARKGA
ncbi:MAG: hypothetical protein O9308_17180 [Beijerinckiaceae bacterium]|nr:hypothetical protein [Beijerinckiaceae bacterium]